MKKIDSLNEIFDELRDILVSIKEILPVRELNEYSISRLGPEVNKMTQYRLKTLITQTQLFKFHVSTSSIGIKEIKEYQENVDAFLRELEGLLSQFERVVF